jgi:hypothetical protein
LVRGRDDGDVLVQMDGRRILGSADEASAVEASAVEVFVDGVFSVKKFFNVRHWQLELDRVSRRAVFDVVNFVFAQSFFNEFESFCTRLDKPIDLRLRKMLSMAVMEWVRCWSQ